MKKPRPFSLKPIYIDEHRERLAQAEHRVAGGTGAQAGTPQLSFSVAKTRQKGGGAFTVSTPMLLSVVLILLASLLLIIFS